MDDADACVTQANPRVKLSTKLGPKDESDRLKIKYDMHRTDAWREPAPRASHATCDLAAHALARFTNDPGRSIQADGSQTGGQILKGHEKKKYSVLTKLSHRNIPRFLTRRRPGLKEISAWTHPLIQRKPNSLEKYTAYGWPCRLQKPSITQQLMSRKMSYG